MKTTNTTIERILADMNKSKPFADSLSDELIYDRNENMKEHIDKTNASFERLSELLVRMDERMSRVSSKEEVQKVESDVGHLKGDVAEIKTDARDMKNHVQKIEITIAEINGRLSKHDWMLGLIIAGIAGLIIKSFFGS